MVKVDAEGSFSGGGLGARDARKPGAPGGERLRSLCPSSLSDSTSGTSFGVSMSAVRFPYSEVDAPNAAIAQRLRDKPPLRLLRSLVGAGLVPVRNTKA